MISLISACSPSDGTLLCPGVTNGGGGDRSNTIDSTLIVICEPAIGTKIILVECWVSIHIIFNVSCYNATYIPPPTPPPCTCVVES